MTSPDEMMAVILGYGIRDERVLEAMRMVDRAMFVPEEMRKWAYEDRPLPIGYEQTISQPYTVARMVELVVEGRNLDELRMGRVLEIGTGSGYQAAVLAKIFGQVFSVEVIRELSEEAWRKLVGSGVENVSLKVDDGKRGWREFAPFDGILVAADAAFVPAELVAQLEEGGRIAIPVLGQMRLGTRTIGGRMEWEEKEKFSFVPLI